MVTAIVLAMGAAPFPLAAVFLRKSAPASLKEARAQGWQLGFGRVRHEEPDA